MRSGRTRKNMAETLEDLIDKATDPSKSREDVDYTTPVCDRINIELDGPLIGIRYIATKVKSAREEEALLGLNLIEACVQNCGQRFHAEVGKYRFLNELIKLISSKYDGDWTPDAVKKRIVQCMYSWTLGLPKETKIAEAYKMLKQQGIVTKDPKDPYATPSDESTSQEKPKDTIFQDEEKSKLLSRLLKSTHPEDLQAANRLIKTMVRQDEMKMERLVKRNTEIETCCNNIKLLTEMLNHYSPSSPSQDKELMKELYDACDRMRPQLFRLASSATEDGDEGLADILRVNDDLSRVLEYYRRIFGMAPLSSLSTTDPASPPATQKAAAEAVVGIGPEAGAGAGAGPGAGPGAVASTLIDLGATSQQAGSTETPVSSVLENELKALGLHDIEPPPAASNSQIPLQVPQQPGSAGPWALANQNFGMLPTSAPSTVGVVRPMGQQQVAGMMAPVYMGVGQMPRVPFQAMSPGAMSMAPRPGPVSMGTTSLAMPTTGLAARGNLPAAGSRRAGDETRAPNALDLLGQEVLQNQKQQQKQKQTVPPLQEKAVPEQQQAAASDSMLSLGLDPGPVTLPSGTMNVGSPSAASFPPAPPKPAVPLSLDNVFVPLDTITPANHAPLTVLDKNSVRITFHFAKTSAELSRSDLLIVVISTMSSLSSAVKNFVFQAAVPKTMRVKLQPPSGSELPPHNPILPPSAITQVMLIANQSKEKIRLKYKISYEVDGSSTTETGEVDSFPSVLQG